MWSGLPVADMVRRRIFRRPARSLYEVADREWEVAPPVETVSPPAYFLPGQLERIQKWTFTPHHPRVNAEGGFPTVHGATRAFLLRNATLLDGVLYKGDAALHLHRRLERIPKLGVDTIIERGSVYSTFPGNRYFGQWLMDDCAAYPLALQEGTAVSTNQPIPTFTAGREGHTLDYERRLGMKPARLTSAFFRELVIFDDVGQNRSKRERFRRLGEKLVEGRTVKPHPGVFIVRGGTGERRLLKNELEIAEALRAKRGFRVVDIRTADVATLIDACAGARVVAGVEGSHLLHGIVLLTLGGSVLTLQTPSRYCPILKDLTDRDEQNFAFVIGSPDRGELVIDINEVERTLDLLPTTS